MATEAAPDLTVILSQKGLSFVHLAEALTTASGDDAVSSFFDTGVALELRRVRAAALIHALGNDPDLLEGRGLRTRRRALALVDDAFGGQLRGWGVPESGEDFERFAALAALPRELQRRVDAATEQVSPTAKLERVGNEFQRALGAFRPLVQVVVPQALVTAKLADLLNAIGDMNDAEGPQFIACHARASELLSGFATDVDLAGDFALAYFAPLVSKLRPLLESAYRTNPATEPAEVAVKTGGKKYPLLSIDLELRLGVRLTNEGRGQALDVRLEELDASGVDLRTAVVPVGTLMPGETATPSIAATAAGETDALVTGRIGWTNSDGTSGSAPFEVSFASQRSDVDWEALRQPYDLDPVRTTDELVGRADMLRELLSLVGARKVGNAFLTGQKRVGKTSLALTMQDSLGGESDLAVLFVEAGTYIHPSAEQTITGMGEAIAEELAAVDDRFADLASPSFEATLAPLRGAIGQLRRRVPKLRVLVILDEFDELPIDLYRRGNIGDAFFLALRALSAQEHIGFLLVGGEKMDPIIDAQGDQLNKFLRVPVTYLERTRHWDDFSDLVRRPVVEVLEITDEAVTALYDQTAGHPYFTKLICQAMFNLAVSRRDSHVTEAEVQDAVEEALRTASVTNFIHFWEDGILAGGERAEQISVRRRKILLAYAEGQEHGSVPVADLLSKCETYGLTDEEAVESIREFERRDVLRSSDGVVKANVRFFDLWLRQAGVTAITTTFTDPDAILHAKRRELEERVAPEELLALVGAWGHYRGKAITPDDVRVWLGQFADTSEQRLMFKVLQALRFYDASQIRQKLREAHGVAVRGVRQRFEKGKMKRDEFAVSYFGGPAKSGARYARLYADENAIYAGNVVSPEGLAEQLDREDCQALVLVDDFLGSGHQASEYVKQFDARHGGLVRRRELKVFLAVICGFGNAQQRLQDEAERLQLPVEIHVCDVLGSSDRCFEPESGAFETVAERERARELAESYGRRLQRKAPLGFENLQAAVVFDEGCPNGSLPILWDSNSDWRALFPRHKGR